MTASAGVFRAMLPGLIYFIQCGDRPLVKIGWAVDPPGRLKRLQAASPDELHLLATAAGTMADERAWHGKFSHLCVRGEWFHLTAELEEAIEHRERVAASLAVGTITLCAAEQYRSEVLARTAEPARRAGAFKSVLTQEDAALILADRRTIRAIATQFGVSKTCVQDIKMRRTWRHVPSPTISL